MSLIKEFNKSGNWLFKYRSYLPLLLIPFLIFLLINSLNTSNNLLYLGISISFCGEIIRIFSIGYVPIGTSGRNTKYQLAKSLNTEGLYSIVRHPLYLGNFFIYLGPFVYTGSLYGIVIFILIFWIYYERIMFAEEAYLTTKFDNYYIVWASKTPAFIPSLLSYKPNRSKFSINKILEREYSGIFGIFFIYTILIIINNYFHTNTLILSTLWQYITAINVIVYILLRSIKKNKRKRK